MVLGKSTQTKLLKLKGMTFEVEEKAHRKN